MSISIKSASTYPYDTNAFNNDSSWEKFQLQILRGNNIEKTDEISEGEVLGIGFIKANGSDATYAMTARYAEESTKDNPVVQVSLGKGRKTEYFNININDVNPSNATGLEMFAFCNYLDDINKGVGSTFGTWQTLKYIDINASINGFTQEIGVLDSFMSVKKDWVRICSMMQDEYLNAGIFKQYKDCLKLKDVFSDYII